MTWWNPFTRKNIRPVLPKEVKPAPLDLDIELIQLQRLHRKFEMNRLADEALCRIRGNSCPE